MRRFLARIPRLVSASSSSKDDPIDPPATVVRHVQRAVGPLGDAYWPMSGGRRQRSGRSGESVGEGFGIARRHSVGAEWHELDLIAFVRQRRAIEPAVEGDERAAAISRRELLS